MDYEEAMAATVSAREARAEINKHDLGMSADEAWAEFIADVGDKEEYLGSEVLDWLGY